ncbi:hypothetical protein ACFL59_12690 [Planctomycetota bacterium]
MLRFGRVVKLAGLCVILLAFSASATTVVYLGDDDLIDNADKILHATVVDKSVHRTPDGKRIYTEYRFRVEEMLKGQAQDKEVKFREWGGRHPDGTECWIPGRGDLSVGDEAVVLLGKVDPSTGIGFTEGLALGKLHVHRGPKGKLVRRSTKGLVAIDGKGSEVIPPNEVRSLTSWKKRIRERVARRR